MSYSYRSEEHEAVRLMQSRMVASLFASSVRESFALKGGLALQAVMGSERATADMDLDASRALPIERLREAMRKAVDDSVRGVLDGLHVSEPKQTDTVCRWKIWGTLPGTASEVHFKVEVSRRDALATPEDASWFYWRSEGRESEGTKAKAHRPETLCFMKLKALISPMRDAPRDLHDLNVLIEAGYKPPPALMAKLGDEELAALADEAWGKLELMDFARFMSEVAPYLPPEVADKLDPGTYDEMRIRVGSCVESWMREEAATRLGTPGCDLGREEMAAKLAAKRAKRAEGLAEGARPAGAAHA